MYLGKVQHGVQLQLYHKITHTKLIIDINKKHYYIINRNIIIKLFVIPNYYLLIHIIS